MKKLNVIFLVLISVATIFPQKTIKTAYKIMFDDHHLTIKHNKKNYRLALGEAINAAKITDAELIFADKKGSFTYLIVAVSGQSKYEQDDRHCGAGMESNLIWIKLNSRLKVSQFMSERYESCWSSVSSNDGFLINGKTLKMSVDNFRDETTTNLFYNSGEPEMGFRIEHRRSVQP